MTICICSRTPVRYRCEVTDKEGKILYAFHKLCPIHGYPNLVVTSTPMNRITKSVWVTAAEAVTKSGYYRAKEGLRIIQRSPDGMQALIEWVEWETQDGGHFYVDSEGLTRFQGKVLTPG